MILHIFLTVLKVIGILLLVVLGLVLLILLSALFVPVCYRMCGSKTGKVLTGKGSVSWLFGLIHFSAAYTDSKAKLEIYLFGIPLVALKGRIDQWRNKRRKSASRVKRRTAKKPVVQQKKETARSVPRVTDRSSEVRPQKQMQQEDKRQESPVTEPVKTSIQEHPEMSAEESAAELAAKVWSKMKEVILKVLRFPARVLERIRKSRLTIKQFCDKIKQWYTFLQMDDTKQALAFLKGKGFLVLRHVLPVKIQGTLHFGFEDPSITGQVLALAGMVYPLYGKTFRIIPDFEQQILEGEVNLKGRIFGGYLLLQAWQIYRCKEIRRTYQRFQHKEA